MSIDIRLPKINAITQEGQEIKSYLYQLVEQLNWALNTVSTENAAANVIVDSNKSTAMTEKDAQDTFNSIKSLIIKSADIIKAYEEKIKLSFSGEYVAQSDFGEFMESSMTALEISPTVIRQSFEDIQSIYLNVENIDNTLIDVLGNIRTGLLEYDDDGVPVYGVEVGQRTEVDGIEVFNKFARFTANKLSFYDANGNEVAYVSDYKLYITNAQILGNLTLGRYVLETSSGIAFRWV